MTLHSLSILKKTSKDKGPAIVGIQLKNEDDLSSLLERMKRNNLSYEYINNNETLFNFLT